MGSKFLSVSFRKEEYIFEGTEVGSMIVFKRFRIRSIETKLFVFQKEKKFLLSEIILIKLFSMRKKEGSSTLSKK